MRSKGRPGNRAAFFVFGAKTLLGLAELSASVAEGHTFIAAGLQALTYAHAVSDSGRISGFIQYCNHCRVALQNKTASPFPTNSPQQVVQQAGKLWRNIAVQIDS